MRRFNAGVQGEGRGNQWGGRGGGMWTVPRAEGITFNRRNENLPCKFKRTIHLFKAKGRSLCEYRFKGSKGFFDQVA